MIENYDAIFRELFLDKYAHSKNIIAVCSGSYNTGKTWLSFVLAYAFSSLKRKVLFFDGDCSHTNISSFADINVPYTLSDAINKQKTLNQLIYSSDKYGIDIICGNPKDESLNTLPIGTLQLLIDDLTLISRFYDDVLLDISAKDAKTACFIAGMAKKVIMILSPNPKTMVEGYEFIHKMIEQHPYCEINIVVNQVNSVREGEQIYSTFVKTINRHLKQKPALLGVVCNDTRIKDCQKNQTVILSRYPNAEVSAEVLKIAQKLV